MCQRKLQKAMKLPCRVWCGLVHCNRWTLTLPFMLSQKDGALEISMKSTPMRTKKAASNLKVADRTMVASHRWLQRTVSLQLLKSVLCLAATATGLS